MCPWLRLLEPELPSAAVIVLGRRQITVVDADPRGFVRHLALLVERVLRLGLLARCPVGDHHLLVLHGIGAIPGKGIRDRHRALRGGLCRRRRRPVDRVLEDSARFRVFAERVEHVTCPNRDRVGLQLAADGGECLLRFTVAHQLRRLPQML
jgi:hypothetical protein